MGIILSLDFKNNNIRFIEFLPEIEPEIDFGVLSFGFIGDKSGSKREKTDISVQADEPQPATQVALPSGLSLEDKVIPDGIGTLEQMSYHVKRKTAGPQVAVFSYLFFDKQPRHSFPDSNPRYPLYAYLALRKSFPYTEKYKTIVPTAEYFTEAPYEPAELSKQHSYAANHPLVHIVLLEQFDSQKESYYKASLFAPKLKVPTGDVYGNYAQDFHTNAKPLSNEQLKPVEIAATFTKLLYPITLLNQQTHAAEPESGTYKLTDKFLKTPPQIQETKPTQKISFETQGVNPIPQNPATLEANVRNIYRLQSMTHQIYDVYYHHQTLPSVPDNPKQKAQADEQKLESRIREFPVQYYTSGKKYVASSSSQDLNPKKVKYDTQRNASLKIDVSNPKRNYDISPKWINVPSSSFWQTTSYYLGKITIKPNNIADNGYKQKIAEPQREKDDKSQDKSEPSYKRDTKISTQADEGQVDAPKEQIKPRYEPKKKDETEKPTEDLDSKIKLDYQSNDNDKKPEHKESSALAYVGYVGGAVAGIGVIGLAKLASLFRKKSREVGKPNLQLVSNQPLDVQKSRYQTIDNVVASHKNNEISFTQEFKDDIGSLIKRVEQLGYGNVSISIRNNLTGEYYGHKDRKSEPQPSHAKIAIAFAAAYLAQKGLLDLKKKIGFDPGLDKDLILERELADYPEFKTKNQFDYGFLQKLMIRDSGNTPTNLILKFIGNGDVYEGMKIVNKVMREVGLGDINVEAPYNRIFEYTKNVATTEAIERLMGYILKGKYLKPEYSSPIKEDLQNERWMEAFRDKLQGVTSGTKVHIHKHGTGFAAYLGDYTIAVSFDDSKTELYTDKARSAKHLLQELNEINEKRVAKPPYTAANHEFGEIFSLLGKHLFKLTYQQPYKKAA